jgi:hypothetical protein
MKENEILAGDYIVAVKLEMSAGQCPAYNKSAKSFTNFKVQIG